MTDLDLEVALLAVHDVLDRAGVSSALSGGIANNLYRAEPRATNDVDLYIICGHAELIALTRLFESEGWGAHPAWRKVELLRLERGGHPRVDLLIASTEYERQAIERARPIEVGGRLMRVLTAEDLIVFKLVAGRLKDYEGVAAIIATYGSDLDSRFIIETLSEFGFADRWTKAVEAAELEAQERG